jgi:hypothetical protein
MASENPIDTPPPPLPKRAKSRAQTLIWGTVGAMVAMGALLIFQSTRARAPVQSAPTQILDTNKQADPKSDSPATLPNRRPIDSVIPGTEGNNGPVPEPDTHTEFVVLKDSSVEHDGSLSKLTVTMQSESFTYTFVCNSNSRNCFTPAAGTFYALITRNNYAQTALAHQFQTFFSRPQSSFGELIALMPHDSDWWARMKKGEEGATDQIGVFYLIKSEPLK